MRIKFIASGGTGRGDTGICYVFIWYTRGVDNTSSKGAVFACGDCSETSMNNIL